MRNDWLAGALAAALLLASFAATAATYPLPEPGNDLVGEITTTAVRDGETLIDIAREHGLGYNEIVAANPGIDPWLPPVGAEVILPTRYTLPSAPREGIIVNLAEMRLYFYPAPHNDEAPVVMTYPIGIGQEGWSTPVGITTVIGKIENPSWTVPQSIRQAHEEAGRPPMPAIVPPGPDNPLGKHALRLGWTSYLIHGTNKAFGVGMRVSHGCIRMYPEDIEALFGIVPVTAPVWVIDQPFKLGRDNDRLYLEVHAPVEDPDRPPADYFSTILAAIEAVTPPEAITQVQQSASLVVGGHTGMPEPIGDLRSRNQGGALTGWMVQIGAFSNKDNASRLASKLSGVGAPVTVQARVNDGFCHVLVGPYADENKARAALDELRQSTGHVGRIIPADRYGMLSECLL